MSLFTFDELKDVASGATPMNLLTFLTDMLDFDHQDEDYDWQWGWESNVANWLWDEDNNATVDDIVNALIEHQNDPVCIANAVYDADEETTDADLVVGGYKLHFCCGCPND